MFLRQRKLPFFGLLNIRRYHCSSGESESDLAHMNWPQSWQSFQLQIWASFCENSGTFSKASVERPVRSVAECVHVMTQDSADRVIALMDSHLRISSSLASHTDQKERNMIVTSNENSSDRDGIATCTKYHRAT
jgi:hypothetical protein